MYYHACHCQLQLLAWGTTSSHLSAWTFVRGVWCRWILMRSPPDTTGSEKDMLSGWVENTHGWGQMGTVWPDMFSRMIPIGERHSIAPCFLAGAAFTHFPLWLAMTSYCWSQGLTHSLLLTLAKNCTFFLVPKWEQTPDKKENTVNALNDCKVTLEHLENQLCI